MQSQRPSQVLSADNKNKEDAYRGIWLKFCEAKMKSESGDLVVIGKILAKVKEEWRSDFENLLMADAEDFEVFRYNSMLA